MGIYIWINIDSGKGFVAYCTSYYIMILMWITNFYIDDEDICCQSMIFHQDASIWPSFHPCSLPPNFKLIKIWPSLCWKM